MKLFIPTVLSVFVFAGVVRDAQASRFIGDLVYCDVDANGMYDAGDFPLNGVEVLIECVDNDGAVCMSTTAVTGTLHPTVANNLPDGDPGPEYFMQNCSQYVAWDATDPSTLDGRYAVEMIIGGCRQTPAPWSCVATVNIATLPASCDNLVTPQVGGYPYDGNDDGDFCDAEDGPFPEGQVLGAYSSAWATCEEEPDPAPADNQYNLIVIADECSVHLDFGYTPGVEPPSGASRTPGFWKTHPWAVEMQLPISFCGEEINDVCRVVELLSTKGGGFEQFTRHAVAGMLNCSAFGCPAETAEVIGMGDAACIDGTDFDYGAAGDYLDAYNNSGTDIFDEIDQTGADPKVCKFGGFYGIIEDTGPAAGCAAVGASPLALLAFALLRRRR